MLKSISNWDKRRLLADWPSRHELKISSISFFFFVSSNPTTVYKTDGNYSMQGVINILLQMWAYYFWQIVESRFIFLNQNPFFPVYFFTKFRLFHATEVSFESTHTKC